jgi:hypothetical protein
VPLNTQAPLTVSGWRSNISKAFVFSMNATV